MNYAKEEVSGQDERQDRFQKKSKFIAHAIETQQQIGCETPMNSELSGTNN